MKRIILLALILACTFLSACGDTAKGESNAGSDKNVENNETAPESKYVVGNEYCFENTTWGMSREEVIKLQGEPTEDTGEVLTYENKEFEGIDSIVTLTFDDNKLVAAYYNFVFKKDNELTTDEELKDLENGITKFDRMTDFYFQLLEKMKEYHGEPSAQYTAYVDPTDKTRKSVEELDPELNGVYVLLTRWDGDNYRFLNLISLYDNSFISVEMETYDHDLVDTDRENKGNN